MTTTRKIGLAIAVLIALFVAFNIYYFMPRTTMASITGTDVKRMDSKDVSTGDARTRDVRFIYATEIDTGKAVVFRNEDNGWYFKFDAGDIAAEASKLAKNEIDEIALIKYYGVRIPVFDSYPNVLSIKKVDRDYVYVPWVNMIVLVLLLIVFIWGGVKVRKVFRSAKAKITNRPAA